MINSIEQLLTEYRRQLKADPATTDKKLPETACKLIAEELDVQLAAGHLDAQCVHLANDISYWFGGDKHLTVRALRAYLTQTLSIEEAAWARWQLIDNLAMLRQHHEVVEKHKAFLAWAKQNLEEDRLLWVMYDSTQAFCWKQAGKSKEWLQIFEDVMREVTASESNRYDRFVYLRSATRVYVQTGEFDKALTTIDKIYAVSQEDPGWSKSFAVMLEACISEINLLHETGEALKVRQIGEKTSLRLREYHAQRVEMDLQAKRDLAGLYYNLAASLYFVHLSDSALPLFRAAIELDNREEWYFSRFAACLWSATKDRSKVLPVLSQGSHCTVGPYKSWMQLQEFQDVVADSEFLNAAGLGENS